MPLSRYIYRPVGFVLTWIAIRIGITTESASYLSAIVGILSLFLMVSNNNLFIAFGIFGLHLFNLFDCIDGSIARSTGTENVYGKYLDSVIGDFINFNLFFVLGIMVYRNNELNLFYRGISHSGSIIPLIIGILGSFFYFFLHHIENIYQSSVQEDWFRFKNEILPYFASDQLLKNEYYQNENIYRLIDRNLRARETQYFFLIFAYWFNFMDLFLYVFFIFYISRSILSFVLYGSRALAVKGQRNNH